MQKGLEVRLKCRYLSHLNVIYQPQMKVGTIFGQNKNLFRGPCQTNANQVYEMESLNVLDYERLTFPLNQHKPPHSVSHHQPVCGVREAFSKLPPWCQDAIRACWIAQDAPPTDRISFWFPAFTVICLCLDNNWTLDWRNSGTGFMCRRNISHVTDVVFETRPLDETLLSFKPISCVHMRCQRDLIEGLQNEVWNNIH